MKFTRNLLAALALFCTAAFAQLAPFTPVSTSNIPVTASAQTLALPNAITGTARQLVATVSGTQLVFVVCDGSNAGGPTTATVSNGMPLLANSQVVLTVPAAITSCSVIGAATGSTLYLTVGVGS